MPTRGLLTTATQLIDAGDCGTAAAILGNALTQATQVEKPRIAALLERTVATSQAGACNLGLMLLCGDGIPANPERGAGLLQGVVDRGDPAYAAFAHNFLGHFHRGGFGGKPDMQRALHHFEMAAQLGHAEAAFNAGLYLDKGARGIRRNAARAAANYQLGASNESAKAMTNLALMIMTGRAPGGDTDRAAGLLQSASALGDDHATMIIALIEEEGTEAMGGR